jgi:hypothetical protein
MSSHGRGDRIQCKVMVLEGFLFLVFEVRWIQMRNSCAGHDYRAETTEFPGSGADCQHPTSMRTRRDILAKNIYVKSLEGCFLSSTLANSTAQHIANTTRLTLYFALNKQI